MQRAVVWDCEFLTADGAPLRQWAGPQDPDPLPIQIGAVRLALDRDFAIEAEFETLIAPVGRFGRACEITPFVTGLTGIEPAAIADRGVSLPEALAAFDAFSLGARLWSWGKDELAALGIACYIGGIVPPIPASRCDNACRLLLKSGMPAEEIARTRSGELAGRFGLSDGSLRPHDGLDDARGVARVLQMLLRTGRLTPSDFGA